MSETTNNVITEEKAFTLRKLNAGDVAPMCVILSNIGVNEFRSCFSKPEIAEAISSMSGKSNDEISTSVGFGIVLDIAGIILNNYPKAEREIQDFIASLSGMTSEQVKELDLDVFFEIIIAICKKDEFKGFMKVVSKLFK